MNTLKFTERESEIDEIKSRWRLASNIKDPNPQIMLIKGGRGVGKTRLAIEFYRWLSENIDVQSGPSGYWPDAMAIYRNAIDVNPLPSECDLGVSIPFLWWGLHVSADSIASSDRYLDPHLAKLFASSIVKRKGIDIAYAIGRLAFDVGLHFFEDAAYVSLAKRLAGGAKEGVAIIRGGMGEVSTEKALKVPQNRANSIIQKLESVFDPRRDYAGVPGAILIDDAQDADPKKDPAVLSFAEQLFHKAMTQKWPMLILITHWNWTLSSEVTPQEDSFAGLLRHCRHGDPSENGPAAGLPGGFLNESNFSELELGSLADLSDALREQLPGLTDEQSSSMLKATDGNPRYLEQVILYALGHKGHFEDHDTNKSLNLDGFRKVLNATRNTEIFEVVRERLIDAPVDVQEAICLASLQGERFAIDLVDAVAQVQIAKDVRKSLEKAEDHYAWVDGTKRQEDDNIGTFVDRLSHQVAEDVRPHVKSLGTESKLQVAFKDTIRGLVHDEEFANSGRPETQLIAYGIAADLFEKSSDPNERRAAQQALGFLGKVELSRRSLEAATSAYERLLAIEPAGAQDMDRARTLEFLAAAYWRLNRPSKCSSAIKRRIYDAYSLIGDQGRILAFAGDIDGINKHFKEFKGKQISAWRAESIGKSLAEMDALATEIYYWAVRLIVPALLHMSELTRAWPKLSFDDNDDPISKSPFLFTIKPQDGDIGSIDHVSSDFLAVEQEKRAYNLGSFAGEGVAERAHFRLLVDDIARNYSDELNFESSIDALRRALKIAEDLGDIIYQIQVLSNLGVVYGQTGDREQSEKSLLKAEQIHKENYTGEAFSVVALSNGTDVEHRRAEDVSDADKSRILGHLNIPIRLAPLFDQEPDEAVGQFRKLVGMVGNIEGNLGHNALQAADFDKAEARFKYALENFADLNDGPNIAMSLSNLASVAKQRGDRKTAYDYWRQSLSVYEKLKEVDSGKVEGVRWNNAINELHREMNAVDCE